MRHPTTYAQYQVTTHWLGLFHQTLTAALNCQEDSDDTDPLWQAQIASLRAEIQQLDAQARSFEQSHPDLIPESYRTIII